MKILKVACHLFGVEILLVLILLSALGCRDSFLEEPMKYDPISLSNEKAVQLNDMLNQIDLESDIVIVQKDGSIQEAVNAVSSGDVIYIEPGIYKESITSNKQDITLIGLSSSEEEQVILENSKETVISLFPLKSSQFKRDWRRITMDRKDLGGKIAHYTFDVAMGEAQFDIIRIHRVVRESRPYHPIRTKGDVFMVHGAIQDFDDIFLTAGTDVINAETSAPFYLATKNIDVWGIDMAWTKVPIETSDFTFMKDWGLERDIDHTLKAMVIARLIRGFTGQGFCKMNLLGFSYGVHIAYGAAARETQIHPICRDVKGIISVDNQIKFEDETTINNQCMVANKQMELINSGEYHNPWGVGLINLGSMALDAPDEPSPVPDFAGLTNIQVINAIASDHSSGFHFCGGTPFELYYTDPSRFVRLAVNLAPHMPRLMFYEMAASACPSLDVSFDDHLGDIKLPILYISAEGGDGQIQDYTSSLTKSTDITRLNVIDPGVETQFNIGHADIWMGYDAKDYMWEELCNWLIDHDRSWQNHWASK